MVCSTVIQYICSACGAFYRIFLRYRKDVMCTIAKWWYVEGNAVAAIGRILCTFGLHLLNANSIQAFQMPLVKRLMHFDIFFLLFAFFFFLLLIVLPFSSFLSLPTYVWQHSSFGLHLADTCVKSYLGVKTVKIIDCLYLSRGRISCSFRFRHLKLPIFYRFWEKFNFRSNFGQNSPFLGDNNFDVQISIEGISMKTI